MRMQTLPDAQVPARTLSPKWNIATEGLSAAQRQTILDRMEVVSFEPKEILFDQDEPSDTLLLVTEGRIRLFQTLENGEQFTFGICLPGTILGLAATVTGQSRILSAESLESATASIMTRTDFLHCLVEIPPFHWNITRLLAILSIESIERSGPMVLDRASVRLGTVLKSLARPEPGDTPQQCLSVVDLTQQELARMIGVSRSWVAIALSEFERLGLISKSRGKIVIRNTKRLDDFIAEQRNH
ncbi:Crp/Fnr family transcriptional regulator [Bradyrhizobium retamae]|uniref:Crp/Fnr family transcriptional regulator n=1 Tax=Bradyrhizobium retamae TaxID=1300035 RepID=A0A0R3NIZ1_9BRAD|nr:Crp/Fnr family transcriptional regulator [Bradyrhizobium retamae]KRR30293.1 hypothetical protein CQ13_01140 [Bradyrhizobium retamae]